MSKQGLSRQVGMALAMVGVVMALMGAVSVWRMFVVADAVENLSEKYIQESQVCGSLRSAVQEAMYNMRGFAFSGDETLLTEARTSLKAARSSLSDAQNLVDRFPDLMVLESEIGEATEALNSYDKLVEDTVAARRAIDQTGPVLDTAAATYMENCAALLGVHRRNRWRPM